LWGQVRADTGFLLEHSIVIPNYVVSI